MERDRVTFQVEEWEGGDNGNRDGPTDRERDSREERLTPAICQLPLADLMRLMFRSAGERVTDQANWIHAQGHLTTGTLASVHLRILHMQLSASHIKKEISHKAGRYRHLSPSRMKRWRWHRQQYGQESKKLFSFDFANNAE
ncbi:hypothetical protein PAMP_014312 [Pampus punctatissimus]